MVWTRKAHPWGLQQVVHRASSDLQGEFGLFLLQLGALPQDDNAQQLILQTLRSDHEVQQGHLQQTPSCGKPVQCMKTLQGFNSAAEMKGLRRF